MQTATGTATGEAAVLSDARLRTAKWDGRDRWLSDGGHHGDGRLIAKLSSVGITFYFAYHDSRGSRRFLSLGRYAKDLTLAEARAKADELSRIYRSGDRELHERFERPGEREMRARHEAKAAAEAEARQAQETSLARMLTTYQAHLERQGKQSAGDVRRLFAAHVLSHPVAEKRAADVATDELVTLLGRLTEDGRGRTAAKLRSYMRAAYALALRSKSDHDAPMVLRGFGITANPAAAIDALSRYNRVRDRALSADELRHYMRRVRALPAGPRRDALLLGVLLGGQRPAQLLRVRPLDVDLAGGTVTLLDPKGARRQPRRHVLPLDGEARAIATARLAACGDLWLFTGDGRHPVDPSGLAGEASAVSKAMLSAGESRGAFQLGDLRRTCETLLAAMGVSSDVRAQIQSHGLGGVQQRHYDRHDYMAEKRLALERWAAELATA